MRYNFKTAAKACIFAVSVFSCVLSSVLLPGPNVKATETEDTNGTLKISCSYSSDIQPDENDKFTISYALTGLTEVQKLEIEGAKAAAGEMSIEVPYGVYNVVDISYAGENEEIETLGYGADLIFQVVEGEEPDVLHVAVGEEAGKQLEAEGNGILAKISGYIVNSFEDTPMEGASESVSPEQEEEATADISANDGQETEKRDDEKQGDTIYYDENGDAKDDKVSPVKKIIPLTIMAGIVAVVIFILHKRGSI